MAELAAATGLDFDSLADVLAGRRCPRLDTAIRLADALHVSVDRFARAWAETRRRRVERDAGRDAAREARERFLKERS